MKYKFPLITFFIFQYNLICFAQNTGQDNLIPFLKDTSPPNQSLYWGYCDKDKKIIIPAKFTDARPFYEGLAFISGIGYTDEKNSSINYINSIGQIVIPPLKHIKKAGDFKEGFAWIWGDGKKYQFINKTGKIITSFKYDGARDFHEGRACVSLNDKFGYIDTIGKEIIPIQYDIAEGTVMKNERSASDFHEGLARVQKNNKYGFINKTGKEIIPLKYLSASDFNEGLAKVYLSDIHSGKLLFINKTGAVIIDLKNKYNGAGDFHEGLAKIYTNEKCGYINTKGQEVIPLKYDKANDFSEGLAAVKLYERWGFIDKTGKEIIPTKYDYVGNFSEGLACVFLGKKIGYIDKTGNEIIPLKYISPSWSYEPTDFYFHNGFAKVYCSIKGKYLNNTIQIYIDKNGTEYFIK